MTPEAVHIPYEEVHFAASDGTKLWGWFIPGKPGGLTLLFCHGNAGNLTHRMSSILSFHKLGLSVFIFDYRGYGKSEGVPSERGTYADVEGAWAYLCEEKKIAPPQIIVFGRSLGGAMATYIAHKEKPRALVVESTFTSVPDVAAQVYPWIPVRLLVRIKYPNKDRIGQIQCPVMIIHSPQDEVIPYSHGERLFELAVEPKKFLPILGGHGDGFVVSKEKYRQGWSEFLSSIQGEGRTDG